MKTSEIKTEWDLSILGKKIDDPRFANERKKTKKNILSFEKKWAKNNSYLINENSLLKALQEYEQLVVDEDGDGSEGYYLGLRSAVEVNNPKLKAASKKYTDFSTPLGNKLTFFQLALGAISKTNQKKFLKSKKLENYHFFLKNVFETAKYDLSEKEENLSALLYGVMAGNWDDMTEEFLSKSKETVLVKEKGKLVKRELSFTEFFANVNSPVQAVRDSAARAANNIFLRLGDVYEKEINTMLERKKIYDELRGYERPDTYRHLADNIATSTVDTMLSVVQENFKLAHDYYKFKAKILKKKKLAYHERNVPIGAVSQEFSYKNSIQIVERAFEKLDPEFAQAFTMFAKEGRIDAYPRLGKTDGAFCAGAGKSTPTYILLNHKDDINSVMTIAHEAGHGIHNELMRPIQPPLYCGLSLATAEVASTFCEDFALREIALEMNEQEYFVALGESLGGHVSTVMRQSACYLFEHALHERYREVGYLTKEEIGKIFSTHMKAYMGSGFSYDTGSENWWMYWSHIRRPFYVYSYASGEMISMVLQKMVQEDPTNIEVVKTFMRAGHSDTTENIFKKAGIDITKRQFWEQAFVQMNDDFVELKKMAKKLGKI